MKILLVRLRLIGDVAFTTPLLGAVRRRYPDAHLAYVVEPAAEPVVRGNPNLNEIIVAPKRRGLGRLARRPRRWRGACRASASTWPSIFMAARGARG